MRRPRWQHITFLLIFSLILATPVLAEKTSPAEDIPHDVTITPEASPSERTAIKEEIEQAAEAIKPEDKSNIEFSGKYNLETAVLKALEDNPSIEAARRGATSAEESRKAARGAFGPSLNTTYNATYAEPASTYGNHQNYQWVTTVSQPIFTGFNILATYNSASLSARSEEYALGQAELNLIFIVQENFINLLTARENVESAKDTVERLASQLKVAQAFYDVGLKPRIDVLRAEAQLSEAEDTLLSAQNQVVIQEARLNTLLNLPVNSHVDYVGELAYFPFEQPLEVSLDIASKLRPDLLIARKATEIALEQVTIAESDFYPQISASYSITKSGDQVVANGYKNNLRSTRVSQQILSGVISWDLFSWGTTYYAATAAKQTVLASKASEANTWQEAAYEVKSRYLSITNAAKRIKVAEKTLAAAEEAYRMAVARYQAQVGTNTDVLDAQADLSSAEASLISARGDYMISVASLYNATGNRVPDLTRGAKIEPVKSIDELEKTLEPDSSEPSDK
ncbi:MAG: TolC family protein [Desulfovibrionales bacterium]|nr:TolC family protein [Desulfovibrionales bacterium]